MYAALIYHYLHYNATHCKTCRLTQQVNALLQHEPSAVVLVCERSPPAAELALLLQPLLKPLTTAVDTFATVPAAAAAFRHIDSFGLGSDFEGRLVIIDPFRGVTGERGSLPAPEAPVEVLSDDEVRT
jgi:hypothetical protein